MKHFFTFLLLTVGTLKAQKISADFLIKHRYDHVADLNSSLTLNYNLIGIKPGDETNFTVGSWEHKTKLSTYVQLFESQNDIAGNYIVYQFTDKSIFKLLKDQFKLKGFKQMTGKTKPNEIWEIYGSTEKKLIVLFRTVIMEKGTALAVQLYGSGTPAATLTFFTD